MGGGGGGGGGGLKKMKTLTFLCRWANSFESNTVHTWLKASFDVKYFFFFFFFFLLYFCKKK